MEFIRNAYNKLPKESRLLFGDLNTQLHDPRSNAQDTEIVNLMTELRLMDMSQHFQLRHGQNRSTWRQKRKSQTVESQCDYILGEDRRIF